MVATATLPADFVDLEEFTENIVIAVYAASGVGKTIWAASCSNTFILATEKGTVSAARKYGKTKNRRVKTKFHKTFAEVVETYEWFRDHPNHGFHWLVIDTGTEMHRLILRGIVDERVEKSSDKSGPDKVQLEEYQEQQLCFQRYVTLFNDLGINICWLMQPHQTEDHEGNPFVLPDVHGKKHDGLAKWFCSAMYSYGYMTLEEGVSSRTGEPIEVRQIQWKGSQEVRAKDRFGCLGPFTRNKSLAQIEKMVLAHNAE